jgi:hypothetical protein
MLNAIGSHEVVGSLADASSPALASTGPPSLAWNVNVTMDAPPGILGHE